MYPGSLPYAVPLVFTAILTGALAFYSFRHREAAGATTLGAMLIALAAWCILAAAEFMAPTLSGKILFAKLQYGAVGCALPLWLALALRYTQRAHWLNWRSRFLLSLPGLIIFPLVLTNEWHHLVWVRVGLDPTGSPALLILERGVASSMYTLAAYAFVFSGIVLYLATFTRSTPLYRQQVGIIVLCSLLPLTAHVLYFVGLTPQPGLNLTPFAFGVSVAILAAGFFRFSLLDLSPIAAQIVIDHMRDVVIVLDAHNRFISLNPAACKLLNVGEEVIGRHVVDVIGDSEEVRRFLNVQEIQTVVEVGEGDDRRWYELTISPLRDGRGVMLGRAVLLHDLTRERSLLQLRDDLAQMIVHDLHNPLSAIYVALDMLGVPEWDERKAGPIRLTTDDREALRIAHQSSLRAQEMLDSLLNVARLESGQMPVELQQIDLGDAASVVVREMTPQAEGRRLTLDMQSTAGFPPARADKGLLDRVLRNLIGNAIKFTPAGGRIMVSIRADGADLLVSVADTGPGISASVKTRLFEKFARGDVVGRGYGLGLAFCKLAVETMGGRIWAESPPGQGATLIFALPRF